LSAIDVGPERLHVAIIMDGNGRWARARGLPRSLGHRAGVEAVRRVVRAAPDLGIERLSLFALSADNWRRPAPEIEAILGLLREYLASQVGECFERGVRLEAFGRRDRLPLDAVRAIEDAEARTARCERLCLRIGIDYSARAAIVDAARRFHVRAALGDDRDGFARLLSGADAGAPRGGDVDLLIRSGGEQRLSDFLLWESAWAEIVFSPRMWPDFDGEALAAAVADFRARERRFGGLGRSDVG
jgi:undecaprenyl diphosphate synthase